MESKTPTLKIEKALKSLQFIPSVKRDSFVTRFYGQKVRTVMFKRPVQVTTDGTLPFKLRALAEQKWPVEGVFLMPGQGNSVTATYVLIPGKSGAQPGHLALSVSALCLKDRATIFSLVG